MTLKSRYPGIRAFEESEQFLFFGRNDDIRRLHAQVLASTLVVLFAKSGIGKSSLLNAGLLPLLDYDRFQTVKVRFQNTAVGPTETLKKALENFLDADELRTQTNLSPADAPLWEYLRACRFERYDEPAVPVLIFDQFEEFFEHAPDARQDFVSEMADLIAQRLPSRVYDSSRSAEWRTPVPVKVIFAIRSDRISLLHDLGAEIPDILQNRFELRPLDRAAAREAIVQPAAISRRELATKPFSYDPAALEVILNALENKNGEVESFNLQLICQNIEKQILKNPALGQKSVDTGVFGGAEGIENILRNYYEDILVELPPEEQTLARDFIERGLIVGGRRVGVTEGVERETWRIGPDLLKKLLDSRLVRAEITHLGKSFELSHDAMVEPIARSFRVREAEIERQGAVKRTRRLLGLVVLAVLVAAGAIGFGAWAFDQKKQADAQKEKANVATLESQMQQKNAEDALWKVIGAREEKIKNQIKLDETAQFIQSAQKNREKLARVDSLKKVQAPLNEILNELEK